MNKQGSRDMSDEAHRSLSGRKYISLETYRRNGTPVRTPVWFAEADGVLYVYSLANAGKVKRIRANPRVRVAPCDLRGNLRGEWLEAEARVVEGEEERRGHELLNRKYRPWKSLGDFFSRLRGRRQAILVIRPQ
jgi:PPOX class probable F420-dependent enzyme